MDINNIKASLVKHTPEILTGVGIAGMVTTTVLAVKATPKAALILENAREEKQEPLTKTEVIKHAWKCYIPAAITGATSIACLVGASSVSMRRNAALATAYNISKVALKEYKEKVVETIGEKKEQTVIDAIAQDKLEKDPIRNREVIITDKGAALCYDSLSGRYFKSDRDHIMRAINKLNRRIVTDMYVSLNEFYWELGLDSIELGNDLGWNIDDGQIDIDFSSKLAEDDTPCLVMLYSVAPRYDYTRGF